MHAAFERLSALPDATLTYVGHEYTAGNLRFALSVDPENAALVRLGELVASHPVTVGRTTIGDEKEWNVFCRLMSKPVWYVIILDWSLTLIRFENASCLDGFHNMTCRAATKTGPAAPSSEVMDKLRTLKNNFKG